MKILLHASLLLSLIACTGGESGYSGHTGGGSISSGGGGGTIAPLTHSQIANLFVGDLNLDIDFDVDLVKANTLQQDFVVIYDPLTDSYDAINLDLYDPDFDNAADYYFDNVGANYFDLDFIPDYEVGFAQYEDVYEDYSTGIIFEKTTASAKDLAKVASIKQAHKINKTAEYLSSEFGLSTKRGKEIAKLTGHWKKASKKGMTAAETDKFAAELLGFSISSGISAYKDSLAGDSTSIDSLIEKAADANNITPEHATQLMTKVFGL